MRKMGFPLVKMLVMVTFIIMFAGRAQVASAQKPAGTLTWAVHFASGVDIVDPSEFEGKSTAVCLSVRDPRCLIQRLAGRRSYTVACHVVARKP